MFCEGNTMFTVKIKFNLNLQAEYSTLVFKVQITTKITEKSSAVVTREGENDKKTKINIIFCAECSLLRRKDFSFKEA
jgi:hypothetical protein